MPAPVDLRLFQDVEGDHSTSEEQTPAVPVFHVYMGYAVLVSQW